MGFGFDCIKYKKKTACLCHVQQTNHRVSLICFPFDNRSPEDAAWKTEFLHIKLFHKNEEQPSAKNSEQCFSGKTKQNFASGLKS